MFSLGSTLEVELANQKQKERTGEKQGELAWMQTKSERLKKWIKAAAAIDETRLLVGITCGKPTAEVFENCGNLVHKIAGEITKKNQEAYEKSRPDLVEKVFAAWAAIRKESKWHRTQEER